MIQRVPFPNSLQIMLQDRSLKTYASLATLDGLRYVPSKNSMIIRQYIQCVNTCKQPCNSPLWQRHDSLKMIPGESCSGWSSKRNMWLSAFIGTHHQQGGLLSQWLYASFLQFVPMYKNQRHIRKLNPIKQVENQTMYITIFLGLQYIT